MKKPVATVLIAILLVSGLTAGCGAVLMGSGNLETEEYSFSDFTKIEISSAFEFDISQSSSYSISITADDNVIEKVHVTKNGDTLKINLETIPRLGQLTLKVTVTMPQLRGLEISGACRGTVNDVRSDNDIDIKISGASWLTGNITVGEADFKVSGASIVELQGSADNMDANVSGASRFHLDEFKVNNADVNFSGASLGTVNVSGRLDANLSSASKLLYIGEPTLGTINTSGASTLSEK